MDTPRDRSDQAVVVVARTVTSATAAAQPLDWPRIAACTPRLRRAVTVHRHHYRGHRWYLLRDPQTGQWQRLNMSAYALVKLLDGRRTLAIAQDSSGLDVAQAMTVLDALSRAELLDWGLPEDSDALHERAAATRRRKRLQQLMTPFSIRIPLFDPDRMLTGHAALGRALFAPAGLCAVLVLFAVAGAFAFIDWDAIRGYWSARGFTRYSVLLIPFVYVVMKIAHELAHGLAAKRWGAEVHDMGVVLLLLIPIPYVDTSAAWAFPEKSRRLIVGAAGILAELVLAAIATIVFVLVEPGVVKDVAYTAMLLGSISTVFFNGNPLLRFDGYYVLADAVEIPNLAPRAARYWAYLAERYICGLTEARSPVSARGERSWFFFYGAASLIYRLGVMVAIALFVAAELPVVGMALAISVLTVQLGGPLVRQLRFLLRSPRLQGRRLRALGFAGAGLVTFAIVVLVVPAPMSTYAQGVVWLPERARIRAAAEGVITQLPDRNDATVAAGAVIARIDNPILTGEVRALEWELREAEMRHNVARINDRVDAQMLTDTIARLRADLTALRAQASALEITTPVSGRLVIPQATHLAGRYVHKGDVIAYVLEPARPVIRAVVPQTHINLLRQGVRQTQVRLGEQVTTTLDAHIAREVPAATRELPSAALGTLGGGIIAVDLADPAGMTAAERLYVVDLGLDEPLASPRVGGRAHVRFEHPPEPLGWRLYRAVRQLLLGRLSV